MSELHPDDGRRLPRPKQNAGKPRVGRKRLNIPKTREDAVALAGWAAYQLARGKMDPKQAKALMDMLKEFRAQLDGRDEDAKLAALREATELARQRRQERATG